MALPIKSKTVEVPQKTPRKQEVQKPKNDDVLANHPNEWTVRSMWSAEVRNDIPDDFWGVMVKKEKTGETQFILVSAAESSTLAWCAVIEPDKYKAWVRK
jgi:hypothetical protein